MQNFEHRVDDILPRRLAPRIGSLLDDFLQKRTSDRGLSPSSIQHLMRMDCWLKEVMACYQKRKKNAILNRNETVLATSIEKIAFLKHVPLFREVPANYLLPLADIADTTYLKEGDTLFFQGERGDAMYLVRHGQIDIDVDGVVVNRVTSGECIGEMAIMADTVRTASCVAVEQSELLKISENHFQAIVESQPSVALAVLQIMTKRLRRQTESMLAPKQRHHCKRAETPSRKLATSPSPPRKKFRKRPHNNEDALYALFWKLAFLKTIHLFKQVPEEELVPIAHMAQMVTLKKGTVLFHQGDSGNSIYFVCRGSFIAQIHAVEVSRIEAGNCLGEMAILDGEPRSASCIALEESELLRLSETDFEIILKSQTRVALKLLKILAEKLRKQTRKTIRQQKKSSDRMAQQSDSCRTA